MSNDKNKGFSPFRWLRRMFFGGSRELAGAEGERRADIPVHFPQSVRSAVYLRPYRRYVKPSSGCKFHTRCFMACDKCKVVPPVLTEVKPGHFVACHFAEQRKVDENGNYLFKVKLGDSADRTGGLQQ